MVIMGPWKKDNEILYMVNLRKYWMKENIHMGLKDKLNDKGIALSMG
jgi:hypothetical protein